MNSVRERLLRTLVDRLTAALAPAPVLRQPATPLPREAGPALLVFVEGDALIAHANRLTDRALTVRLVALARGMDAFDAADRLIVAAHAAVLADPNLGGLALAVRELDADWDADDLDAGTVTLPARYEIRYRTALTDLTTPG
jgi:hypothetical protein